MRGVRIIEFASIGPGPFACMMLADMGAEVIRIERPGTPAADPHDMIARGRRAVVQLDLKQPAAASMRLSCCAMRTHSSKASGPA